MTARTAQDLLALKRPSGVFCNFYPSKVQMSMCGPPPYYRVRLTLDPQGDYWAWHSFERDSFDHADSAEVCVEICFPYGSKAEEERGRGKMVRVRVEELGVEP